MKDLTIENGIILPLSLLQNNKLTINDKLVLSILLNFKKEKINVKDNEIIKETLYTTRNNLLKLIPLSKDTIKKSLDVLKELDSIDYINKYNNLIITIKAGFGSEYKKQGYIYIPVEILYNRDLTTNDKIILSFIKGFNKEDSTFNFTDKKILDTLPISKRTLIKSFGKLKELNFIQVDKKTRTSNRTILVDKDSIINYFEHADIRKAKIENVQIEEANIEQAEIENVNITNVEKIEKATFILDETLLKSLDKTILLQYKKEMDKKLTELINAK